MAKEFRVFEVDDHGNKWFVCSRPSLELAKSFIKNVLNDEDVYKVFDENDEQRS